MHNHPAYSAFFLALLNAGLLFLFSCGKSSDQKVFEKLPPVATQHELDSVSALAGSKMIVLDLYADWCMPCRLLAPTLHELSQKYKGKAAFYRINIDQCFELAQSFGVRGIPYVVFMKAGKPVYSLTGLNPKENYEKILTLCAGAATPDACVAILNEKMQ